MKKIIVCYFASIGTFMGFMIFINNNNIPAGILMCVLFTLCLIWFGEIMKQWAARIRERQNNKPVKEVWNPSRIDIPLDDVKNEEKQNVHPGSYPSEAYYKMIEEKGANA